MNSKTEKKHRNIGIIATLVIHGLLFLFFLFVVAWRAPNPPLPEYGIELIIGENEGGENRDIVATNLSEETVEEDVNELPSENPIDEIQSVEPLVEGIADEEKTTISESVNQIDAPIKDKEVKKKEESIQKKNTVVQKKNENTIKKMLKPIQQSSTKKSKESARTKKNEAAAIYKGNTTIEPVDANQGDQQGVLDAKAIYANQGGGVGLDLAGWEWDDIPKPYIPHDELGGKVEFEVKVDSNGELVGYRVIERSLSIEAERACREAISQLTFTKKQGAVVPAVSVGKITFVVRAR